MSYLTEGDSVESSNCLTYRIHSTRGRRFDSIETNIIITQFKYEGQR
jgi:uncharacterized protein YqkB